MSKAADVGWEKTTNNPAAAALILFNDLAITLKRAKMVKHAMFKYPC